MFIFPSPLILSSPPLPPPPSPAAGKAEVTYADGSHYDGYFYRGLREGRGLYTFPDGQQYSGRFLADAIDVSAPGNIVVPRPVRASQDHWMIPLNASLLDDLEKVHGRAGFSHTETLPGGAPL